MQVSEKCIKLLNFLNTSVLNSSILIADLKTIQYDIMDEKQAVPYNTYWHKSLSADMLNLVEEWKSQKFSEDLFLILNKNFKQIVQNDNTKYSAQMIFPLFVNQKLDGFAIYFRTKGDYILSSSKAPKTIRNLIQKELNIEKQFFMEEEMKTKGYQIDLDWFTDENIDLVDNQIELYMSSLLDINDYIQLNHNLQQLILELTSNLPENQRKILKEYQKVELQITSYQNSLAYYLGLRDSSNKK